ncbi:penicillin-binding protein activator [Candidatus Parabeggiatoa sp. HSG14]|uniref:penicillin-binding protein activator n=1 Tax=Candidatus Parabeggiatoa sp. HSG14 TaxID=3055593 RepID=UPI0025A8E6B5|nr:penicillin-binding protein activator [Thiotrichales bacterium HSG14]
MFIRTLAYLFLFSLLFGCSPLLQDSNSLTSDIVQDPAHTGKQLEKKGHYRKAAFEYLRLAKQNIPPAQQTYQLLAIQAFLKDDDLTAAKSELAKFNFRSSYGLEIPLELVHTKIDLAEKRTHKASQRLKGIEPTTLSKPLQIEYKQLHTQMRVAKGEIREAVRESMKLDNLLNADPVLVRGNHQSLWRSLVSSSYDLKHISQKQGELVSGWIALALLKKTVSQKHLQQSINNWQWRFPEHPATQYIVPSLLQNVSFTLSPKKIALLLPFKGQFKGYAEAIKNGFFAAAEQNNNLPTVTMHHVNENNILAVYRKVVAEGADFVVGPLLKNTFTVLAENKVQFPVPTLGLNHLESSFNAGNLYQFGLSPEDEAKAVANRAGRDGHRTAMVLAPDGEWGERVLAAFQTAWKKQRGELAIQHIYGKNFNSSIKRILKKAKTKNIDMAFMVAFPQHARQLRPLFDSVLGYQLPIYSISRVYSGVPEPESDADLEGIMFVDMPWVLAPDANAVQLQEILQQLKPEEIKKYTRLYALGVDAYHLLPRLQQLDQFQWQGYTGHLSLEKTGKIIRNQLSWARFFGGNPYLIEETATFSQE